MTGPYFPRIPGALALLALAIIWSSIAGGCARQPGADGAGADSTAVADTSGAPAEAEPEPAEKAIKVNVGEVTFGNLVTSIFADGEIRTPRSLEVRTKISGQLVEVAARDGDRVREGQLLARIDPRTHRLELEAARYSHLRALSQVAAEGDTFVTDVDQVRAFAAERDRLDAQLADGQVTREEYEIRLLRLELEALENGAFRQDVFQQRTGLADARLAEERARLNLEYTEIRAPFAGVVQGLRAVIGANVAVGEVVCALYDNQRLEAVVNVLEADLGNLTEGRPALVAVPAVRDTLAAEVDVISPNLDPQSRTCEVIIRFSNPDGRFRPGMFARAEIAGFVHPDKLLVPRAAVLIRDDRPLVFKVAGDQAQWLYVTTGLENDAWVEIREVHSGGSLAPGEQVVVSDHLTLAHEATIDIRQVVPPADRWNLVLATGAAP